MTFIKKLTGFILLMSALSVLANTTEVKNVSAVAPNILPYVIVGNLIFISGQVPLSDGKVKYTGQLGGTVTHAQGQAAAKLAAENVLAQLKAAVGSLDKVKRCVKVSGFVNATPDFTAHPQIINAASDVFIAALGDAGRHARVAIGVSSLPLNAAVEVDAIFELK